MTPFFTRLKHAFRTFFAILLHDRIPADVLGALTRETATAPAAATPPPVAAPPATDDGSARAAQMLALLQRDGRLVDFLMEDIAAYADAQIGAAVRDVHTGCRQVLERYVTLEPVFQQDEGATVRLDGSADPARVKIVGTAGTAVSGVLRHRGWIARQMDLPQMPPGSRFVIAPAEIDVP